MILVILNVLRSDVRFTGSAVQQLCIFFDEYIKFSIELFSFRQNYEKLKKLRHDLVSVQLGC